jgi:hypothetical protein
MQINVFEVVKKINMEIEDAVENLIDGLALLKIQSTSETRELKDLVVAKRRFLNLSDSVLKIYYLAVQLKYLGYERQFGGFKDGEPVDIASLFDDLLNSLDKVK